MCQCIGQCIWIPSEETPSGQIDSTSAGVGALTFVLYREHVKRSGAKSSALVKPTVCRYKASVQ